MRPSATARRYAEAAYDVARQDGQVGAWLDGLKVAARVMHDSDAASFFKNPETGLDETLLTIDHMFGSMQPHLVNLLRIVATRHRLHLIPAILREFVDLDRAANGIVEAQVTVARPVEEAERESIGRHLGTLTGKTVEIQTRIDPSILGGIVVRIGDKLIDASVAGRLQRLRQEMAT